jgi:hypothetical protein
MSTNLRMQGKPGIQVAGVELGEPDGTLLGIRLVDGPIDGMLLGVDNGSNEGPLLGWKLNVGIKLGAELGETSGLSVGPLLGI